MRVIKFKVWDKILNCFSHNSMDWLYGDGIVQPDQGNRYAFLQFTGLLDRNGVEIYEGDILTDCGKGSFTVCWSKEHASWCLRSLNWAFSHYFGEAVNPEHCEVIGNIYSNPELLGGGK